MFLKINLKQIPFWDRLFASISRLKGKADRGSSPQTAQSDKSARARPSPDECVGNGVRTTSDYDRCGPWQKALLALVLTPLAAIRMAAKNNFLACKNNPGQDKFTK